MEIKIANTFLDLDFFISISGKMLASETNNMNTRVCWKLRLEKEKI
ncbi:MAG: hypothetical protein QXL86_01055 [Candidatus Aenigmatarchaeota archaeon]